LTMVAGGWLSRRPRLLVPVVTLGACAMCAYAFAFASWAFIA
jgi:tRNA(Arg) A34 adenosine deaminase TadA